MKRPVILSDSSYHGAGSPFGGRHRSAQILECIRRAGCQVEFILCEQPANNLRDYLTGLAFLARHFGELRPAPSLTWRIWRMNFVHYLRAMAKHSGPKLLAWEMAEPDHWIAPYAAQEAGWRTIAFPQNLETRVPGRTHAFTFAQELRHLAKAQAIFCISEEETKLLREHGVNADWLPYHPPEALMNSLVKIRGCRSDAPPATGILLLGAAFYPPTRTGMLEIFDWFREGGLPKDTTMEVAGRGSEDLRAALPSQGFHLHGTVDAPELDSLMTHTRAILVHQHAGGGALTRIPEALSAGIPILASRAAARSATHLDGVHVYESRDELVALMKQRLPMPEMPSAPDESRFKMVLQNLTTF